MNIKLFFRSTLSLMMAVMAFSCLDAEVLETSEDVVTNEEANSSLKIMTRSSSTAEDTSFPIHVYVFKGEVCQKKAILQNKEDKLLIQLQEGDYQVYAIAGADEERYELPTQATATKDAIVRLKEGKNHGNLMTAQNNVTLTYGEEANVTLNLQRKVMLVESLVINNVPNGVKAVTITISPLYENLRIDGSYAGENGSITLALIKEEGSSTWKATSHQYLFEAAGTASIKVAFTNTNDKTISYSYSTSDELKANYKINITGNYTSEGVNLSGTINGTEWAGAKEIVFIFDENGAATDESPGNDNNEDNDGNQTDDDENDNGNLSFDESGNVIGKAPEFGSIYHEKCFVLRSVTSGETTTVTLMTIDYRNGMPLSDPTNQETTKKEVYQIIDTLSVDGIPGWRLPTREEMDYILSDLRIDGGTKKINTALEALGIEPIQKRYYFLDTNGLVQFYYTSTGSIGNPGSLCETHSIRPVTTLTFIEK